MRDAPALRNVELEQLGEFLRRLPGDRVAPGAERDEQIGVLVDGHVAVHHAAKADGADGSQRHAVLRLHRVLQIAVAGLQAAPHILQAVGPDAVLVAVLPLVAAGGDGRVAGADQHRLDARRAELDAKGSLAGFNRVADIVLVHLGAPICSIEERFDFVSEIVEHGVWLQDTRYRRHCSTLDVHLPGSSQASRKVASAKATACYALAPDVSETGCASGPPLPQPLAAAQPSLPTRRQKSATLPGMSTPVGAMLLRNSMV